MQGGRLSHRNLVAPVPMQAGRARPFRLSALHNDPDRMIRVKTLQNPLNEGELGQHSMIKGFFFSIKSGPS